MDPEEACVAGEPLRVGWLDGALRESFWQTEEDSHEEQEYKFAAAREMVLDLAPPGIAGPGERMIAVHFVSVHAAATGWQARAISRYLPEAARETAQRFACRLVDITVRLLNALERSAAERRKAEDAAQRRAEREAKQAWKAESERLERLAGGMERFLGGFPDLAPILRDPEAAAQLVAAAQETGATPEAPETPGTPVEPAAPPLNRQQRRAALRRQRKQAKAAPRQGP